MRKLSVDDIYLLSSVADKMDLQIPDPTGKTQEQVGAEVLMLLFKKLHLAKSEVNSLILQVTEKDPSKLTLIEIKDFFKNILKEEGILDFFK